MPLPFILHPSTFILTMIPPGYKQTEVGVIPEEWEVKTIDQIAFVTSGKRLPLGSTLVAQTTPHPYIRVTDMRPGTVELSEIKYVPEDVFPAIKRYRIYCEDIFISVAGSLGIVGKVPRELHGANLTENADRITNITCSQDYLLHVLMSPLIQNTIDSLQTVGAQPKLALTRIRKFVIPHPPLPEQGAIATALSDVDALLAALDRLIAKQRDLKQAAMQQLLTGQTRLPGFTGKWETKRLGEGCSITTGRKDVNEGCPSGEYPFFTCAREHTFSDSYSFEGQAILIAGNGDVGNLSYINGRFEAYQRTYVLQKFTINVSYLWHQLSAYLAGSLGIGKIGSSIPYILKGNLVNFEFRSPVDVPEQTAIATILSDMDVELAALEQRRDKTRALKQGMMQELLTGRTRLV